MSIEIKHINTVVNSFILTNDMTGVTNIIFY